MRNQAISLAIIVVLFWTSGAAQVEKAASPDCVRGTPSYATGTNVFPGAPSPFGKNRPTRDALRRTIPLVEKNPFSSSPIYVIDTAIVCGTHWREWYWFSDTTRHLYSFNARGQRTSDLTQRLTGTLWLDSLLETWTYDADGNMLSGATLHWLDGHWVDSVRYTNTYDAIGNMLSILCEDWSSGQWVNRWRVTMAYDEQRNPLSMVGEDWSDGQWVNSWRWSYAYDANGRCLSLVGETWSTGEWVNAGRETYTYDASGNMLSRLREDWSNGQWVNNARDTWTYDANGLMLSEVHESWGDGQWDNYGRSIYAYDAQGNRLSQVVSKWSNGQWADTLRYTFTYDAQRHRLSELEEYWGSHWYSKRWTTYSYDMNGNLTSGWYYLWMGSGWMPGGSRSLELKDGAGNIYYYDKWFSVVLSYKAVVMGVAAESGPNPAGYSLLQNYPNPFNPTTTIEYELPTRAHVTLTVYNLLGQVVAMPVDEVQEVGCKSVDFNASSLPSGMYLYRLTAGNFVQSKQMIILK